ncbi:pyridoxal-phosphate dependent enzyme [Cecembia sp.]|uniref:1-aminocyclopropane-1-carboxylate deaminase/D-cysteine desulfhydrase n=1 Tax=Cecembia sp. TaxID=1898110 RepID=UPI0025BAA696|nr:pyridoxal-phosphate dependent enzyme [Cecembia sp.]
MLIPNQISVEKLSYELWEIQGVQLAIKRLDQIHPLASGNKFFKLKYNLEQAKKEGKNKLLTFGGAYSNHIYATAAAAEQEGFQTVGVIRGEETFPINPTLNAAKEKGMSLHYISRSAYRDKESPKFIDELREIYGNFYLIPEGGTNYLAIKGTSEILSNEDKDFSHICTPLGTGGTFLGLANSLLHHQELLGFSALKGSFIHQEIDGQLKKFQIETHGKTKILNNYHFGGYGKHTAELLDFIRWFYLTFQIPLEPIYTGKMAYGVLKLVQKKYFPKGSKILLLHTGGIQGVAGFNERFGLSLPL